MRIQPKPSPDRGNVVSRLPDALEHVLTLPKDAFATAAADGIDHVARVSFRGAVSLANPAAAERDARVDDAARALASVLRTKGYRVRLSGASKSGGTDMLRGVLAQQYAGGTTFGEVFCRLDVDVPGVKDTQHLALMRHRYQNAPTYVQDKAELQLAFVDAKSGKLLGSGYGLDATLLDCAGADVPAVRGKLVASIVAHLEDFRALNAKHRRTTHSRDV